MNRVREPVAQPRLYPLTEPRTAILEKTVNVLPVKAGTARGMWSTDALQFPAGACGNAYTHVSVGTGHVQITRRAQVHLDAASQVSFNSCYLTLLYSLGLTDYTRLASQQVPAFRGLSFSSVGITPSFLHGCWRSNSALHKRTVRTLPAELFTPSPFHF